jgi:hypothetical protein
MLPIRASEGPEAMSLDDPCAGSELLAFGLTTELELGRDRHREASPGLSDRKLSIVTRVGDSR